MRNILLLWTILLLLLSGCGSRMVKFSGNVEFSDGTPLETGRVILENEQSFFYGQIHADGSFSVGAINDGDGVPPGKYRAAIGGAYREEGTTDLVHFVAEKYRDPQTSGFEFDIQKRMTGISIVVERPKEGTERVSLLKLKLNLKRSK
jgi:hypothetical protein